MDKLRKWLGDPQVWGTLVSIAVMAVIAVAFFYPDNFNGNSLRQADMQQGFANGHEAQEYYEQTGDKALWTNSLFGGMPTFQISPSYESNSLFDWLNDVYGLWLPAPSNLLFMMMMGFFILLIAMRLRWYYALIGAVAWGFSSYFVIIIGAGHIWKFMALTYVPPTINTPRPICVRCGDAVAVCHVAAQCQPSADDLLLCVRNGGAGDSVAGRGRA